MKRYEGLFILNLAEKEDSLKNTLDRISNEIVKAGGKVETIQKMDKRSFARVANKKYTSGYYVNFIFEGDPSLPGILRNKFALDEEVFRVLITRAPVPKPAKQP